MGSIRTWFDKGLSVDPLPAHEATDGQLRLSGVIFPRTLRNPNKHCRRDFLYLTVPGNRVVESIMQALVSMHHTTSIQNCLDEILYMIVMGEKYQIERKR